MSASGWSVLPVTVSLKGVQSALSKGLSGPLSSSSKKAAKTLESSMKEGAEGGAKAVESAQKRAEKATLNAAKADGKVQDAKDATKVAVKKVESAELALESTRSKSNADVTKAENELTKLRESGTATAEQLEAAEEKVKQVRASSGSKVASKEAAVMSARKKSETATENLTKAEGELSDASLKAEDASDNVTAAQERLAEGADESTVAIEDSAEAMAEAEERSAKFGKALDGAALAVGGLALGAAGGLVKMGDDFDQAFRTIRTGTGATGEAFEGLKDSALSVLDTVPAMDGGMAQVSETLADLNTRLGLSGEPLETMTSQMVELSNMGIDADIDAISQAFNGFGIEASEMPGALDEMFQVSQATGLSVTDLANSAVKAGPQLRGFGFDMADSAALVGQMDKAGLDADGTLQRLSRAMSEFADEGRDAPEALQGAIEEIDSFIESGDQAGAINLASDLFGTRGAAQFVDAVESGTLSVDDFMAATGATKDTILGASEETRTMGESFQLLKQKGSTALQPIATKLVDKLIPALEDGAEKLEDLMGWVEDNKGLVKGLATAVGIAAAAFVTWRAAVFAFNTVTKIATGVQTAFNIVMAMNPIMLVVAAVAALVAGLVWFFTKTETGQKVWEAFMDVLKGAWEWIRDVFVAGWDWVSEKIPAAWQAVKDKTVEIWNGLKQWLADTWDSIKTKVEDVWNGIKDSISGAWDNIKQTISDAVGAVLGKIGEMVSKTKEKISDMVGKITGIKDTVVDSLSDAGQWLLDTGKSIVQGAIDGIMDAPNAIFDAIMSLVPDTIKGAVSTVIGWVSEDGSLAYANGGVEAYANGGTRGGEKHVAQIAKPQGPFRVWAEPETGGEAYIPLAQSKRARSKAILSKTAQIMGLSVVDHEGDTVSSSIPGGSAGKKIEAFANGGIRTPKEMLEFAKGRTVASQRASRSLEGAPYIWGGSNWGDCSGAMSAFAAFMTGKLPFPRKFATGNQGEVLRDYGFNMGKGPAGTLRFGWYNGGPWGGHTAGTLPDGTRVEMGGNRGNGQINGRAAGHLLPNGTNWAWIRGKSGGPPLTGMNPNRSMTFSGGVPTSGTTSDGDPNVVEVDSSNAGVAATATENTPTTWSGIAGDFAKNWAEGMVQDALGVFGISDTLPPIFQARNQYYAMDEEAEGAEAVNARIADAASESSVDTDSSKPAARSASTVENVPEVKAGSLKKGAYKLGASFFWEEIAKAAAERRLGFQAAKIAGGTALVESGDPLRMWASSVDTASKRFPHDSIGSDHDSSGLFQQRNNGAWGTIDQRMNARASAGMFLNEMVKKFPNWKRMEPGSVAQGVQVSAFPSKYAPKMGAAEKALAKFKGKLPSFSTGTSRVIGGSARGVDDVLSLLAQDEAVLTSEAADVMGRDTIAAINSDPQAFVQPTTQVSTAPAVDGGGKGDTYVFQAVNTDELSTMYRRAAAGRVRGAIGAR